MWVPCLEGTTPTQGHMVYHPLNIFLFIPVLVKITTTGTKWVKFCVSLQNIRPIVCRFTTNSVHLQRKLRKSIN